MQRRVWIAREHVLRSDVIAPDSIRRTGQDSIGTRMTAQLRGTFTAHDTAEPYRQSPYAYAKRKKIMTDINHAHRSLERATYTPYKIAPESRVPVKRAWEKWSYLASLKLVRREFIAVVERLARDPSVLGSEDAKHLFAIAAIIPDSWENAPASVGIEAAPLLADVSIETLHLIGATVLDMRQTVFAAGNAAHLALRDFAQRTATASITVTNTVPDQFKLASATSLPGRPGTQVYTLTEAVLISKEASSAAAAKSAKSSRALVEAVPTDTTRIQLLAVAPMVATRDVPSADLSAISIGQLLKTPDADPLLIASSNTALELAARLGIQGKELTVENFSYSAVTVQAQQHDLGQAFKQRMLVEPVGLLHLERIEFTPSGIERGGLSYSVALSPAEEVNISHKEWSNTSEEFQNIVTDYIESFSEQGVAEKSDLTQATNSQSSHNSGFNLGVTASGGFGPVTISTSASFNTASASASSAQVARASSNELTRKASSRSKKEHKMSFKVASASGSEDQAVRKIRNPFTDRCTRIDYYQLLRRWRVDLLRYGVRLTYDLAIPEPGSDILSKIVQINQLTAIMQQGFNAPGTTASWARFDLVPQDIKRNNYMTYAAQFGTSVDAPPEADIQTATSYYKNWPNEAAAQWTETSSFPIEVPENYEATGINVIPYKWWWDTGHQHFTILTDLNTWFGRTGKLDLTVSTRYVESFDIEVQLYFALKQEAFAAWQVKVWSQLRDAAHTTYEMTRVTLKNQLAQLQADLGAQDALSLRQIEREEVMKQVLRWLFGPGFEFTTPGLPVNLYGSNESVIPNGQWSKVLAHGEVIKFLHQAIEWENMIYFLYPYFWSHTSRWELKKYLDHPDFMHRAFLRSGSARVVLTIRPGFERDFVTFLETGKFDELTDGHPYISIAEEMQAYAKTNYPNLPSANPDHSARPLLTVAQRRAWDDIQAIAALLEQYKEDQGEYPPTAKGFSPLEAYGKVPATDPWGRPYVYACPSLFADYEVLSHGANGIPGGEDDDADITSYADASLIGRWYEFTPTPALDIAFDEIMPNA